MTKQGLATGLGSMIVFNSYQFTFNDLAAIVGSGVKTVNLFNALSGPPYNTSIAEQWARGSIALYIRVKHSVVFAGGSLTGLLMRVGKSGGATNFFVPDFNLFSTVADGTLVEVTSLTMGQLSAVTPTVTFTPTGDSCSAATAGVVNIDVLMALVSTPNITPTSSSNVL